MTVEEKNTIDALYTTYEQKLSDLVKDRTKIVAGFVKLVEDAKIHEVRQTLQSYHTKE